MTILPNPDPQSTNDCISIIIPVYNRQDVICECIQSVLSQSHQNFEIILIDDGSDDQTPAICRELAAREPRILLLETAHAGVSAARNKGIDAAHGFCLFFLDSDDVIHPMLLEDLLRGMQQYDCPISGTRVMNVSEKNWHRVQALIACEPGSGDLTFQTHDETLHAVFHSDTPLNLIGGVMMRRELIGQTRFRTDLSIGEDFYFIYQNLIKGAPSVFLTQKRYYARIHTANTSWDFGFSGFWSRFYRRQLVWESEENLGRPEYAACQKRQALGVFLRCLKHNAPGSADSKRMCGVMKDYSSILLPAMSLRDRIRYYISVYLPRLYLVLLRAKQCMKRLLR